MQPVKTQRHAWLLVAITLLILESSSRGIVRTTPFLYSLLFTAVLFAGIYSSGARGRVLWGALILGVPTIILQWLDFASDAPQLTVASFASGALLLLYSCVAIARQILSAEAISTDTLLGSVTVYLMMGILFMMLYSLALMSAPESLSGLRALDVYSGLGTPELLYFSFVTLTTLGYGDILPVSEVARSLAFLEAIIGQLYLTVLIAWLVGLHVAQRRRED